MNLYGNNVTCKFLYFKVENICLFVIDKNKYVERFNSKLIKLILIYQNEILLFNGCLSYYLIIIAQIQEMIGV